MHTTTIEDEEQTSIHKVQVRIDITSLDAAGIEQFGPETEEDETTHKPILTDESVGAVSVLEQADESVFITWDTVDEELKVKNLSDGSDVANNSAVGEVLLEVRGD